MISRASQAEPQGPLVHDHVNVTALVVVSAIVAIAFALLLFLRVKSIK